MYRDFFGLKLSPFNNTPDPRFFYNTPDHEEAVASLIYAAQQRKGFALLTGEVGSGKTLVSRLVLSRLERSAKFAVVYNTRVGPRELLYSICREFDVRIAPDAAAPEMSRALEEFLLDQYARDRLAVVIVDEAQHLAAESFEELRLLGNLEADDAKLMSVLILGQPELQDMFRAPEMRQLQQRLFRSFHLKALTRELTEGYVIHRLRVAGIPKGQVVFDHSALDAVFGAAGGIPRLINQVCDAAMLAAYTRSTKKISAAIVADTIEESRPSISTSRTVSPMKTHSKSHETDHRFIVETRQAEDAVRRLEERAREAAEKRSMVADTLREATSVQRELAAFVDEQHRRLGAIRTELEQANQIAVEQTTAFVSEVEKIRGAAYIDLCAQQKALDERIGEASRIGAELESQSQVAAAQMAAVSREMHRTSQETAGEAKQAFVMIHERSDAALGQLRAVIEQINERARAVRQDLVELSDQVKAGSANSIEGMKQIVGGWLDEIDQRAGGSRKELVDLADQVKLGAGRSVEGLKTAVEEWLKQIDDKGAQFRTIVEHSCERIGRMEVHFGQEVVAAKVGMQQIADDARTRFESTQVQVRDLLTQAQASAATTQEQVVQTLAESRNFADRVRGQIEDTVRRADATAENTLRELQDLRSDLRKDREQVREQVLESKALVGDARQEAVRIVEQARSESARLIELANSTTTRLFEEAGRFERESQARAERIIQHARESEGRVESLLRMPKEIIDEAKTRTTSLAELSKSLSSVVSHLGSAGEVASARKQEITEANAQAEQQLETLRSHTARVGQLVGIIRQLYGVMDTRIERLRERLDQADDLCRSVPQEIDGLRSALTGNREGHRVFELPRSKVPAVKSPSPTPRGKSVVVKSPANVASPPESGMLGDIVSRNRKLHQWLQNTLNEAEVQHPTGEVDRPDKASRGVREGGRAPENASVK